MADHIRHNILVALNSIASPGTAFDAWDLERLDEYIASRVAPLCDRISALESAAKPVTVEVPASAASFWAQPDAGLKEWLNRDTYNPDPIQNWTDYDEWYKKQYPIPPANTSHNPDPIEPSVIFYDGQAAPKAAEKTAAELAVEIADFYVGPEEWSDEKLSDKLSEYAAARTREGK